MVDSDQLEAESPMKRLEEEDQFDETPEAKKLSFDDLPNDTESKELVKVFLRIRPDHTDDNKDDTNDMTFEESDYDAIKALSETTVQTIPPGN